MKMSKMLSYLGLAMRAGKLVTGDEGVMGAIRSREAKLVILAVDASSNAQKKYKDKCASFNIKLIECFSRDELGSSIGKAERVVIAVNDSGFAQMILKCQVKPAEVE
ncbi:MAG: ribosomal protein L7ae [Bacilli bacterium]|jgi:ribosomal protein L7Ae-like RNA K-turn-binding protein|nr:ribosomal protein L7ae [Bacilli bacterium]